jgi:predicted O-methyltransferase YrrM
MARVFRDRRRGTRRIGARRRDDAELNADLRALLADLFERGVAYDASEPDRRRRLRNLEPATAELLCLVLRVARARDIVEIGTSNGYSAIWLADAARDTGGRVTSVDVEQWPGVAENLDRAGVDVRREIVDGGGYLAGRPDADVDLLFLDAERTEYAAWWPHPARVLRPGGVLAVDNVLSHPDEVADLLGLIAADGRFVAETVAVGKGLHLAWLRTDR